MSRRDSPPPQRSVDADPGCAHLECDALLPGNRLTRRAVFGVAAGVVAAGCSKAPKWKLESVATKDGVVDLDLKDHPALATAGGMIAIKPRDKTPPMLVMRVENDQFRVMSLRCPHLGCTVRWDDSMQVLACPCHGSKFSDFGQRLEGPAKSGLPLYQARREGTHVFIKTNND